MRYVGTSVVLPITHMDDWYAGLAPGWLDLIQWLCGKLRETSHNLDMLSVGNWASTGPTEGGDIYTLM